MQTKPLFHMDAGGPPERPQVSVVGLGCNNFGMRIDEAETRAVVHKALDCGITFFDTADMYGGGGKSEKYLGKALGPRRKEIILATKFGYSVNGSKENVIASVEASLKRLGTDVIDLYQIHKPDPDTPIEETLGAMDRLIRDGKLRFIGCSNFSADQLDQAMRAAADHGLARFVTLQNRHSVLHREPEAEVLPACARHGVGFLPFFPLENGLLTGKYRKGETPDENTRLGAMQHFADMALTEENFAIVEELETFTANQGRTLLELAFSWLIANPDIPTVIAGATRPDQIESNVKSASWALSGDDLAEIDRITQRQ